MWPFRRKPSLPPPDNIVQGGDCARFSSELDQWEFEIDGVEFTLSGRNFDENAFEWARAVLVDKCKLESEIDQHVVQVLDGWSFNASSRHLLSISLDDYGAEGYSDLAYIGDDSWGDYGVNVILGDGRIIDAYGGD